MLRTRVLAAMVFTPALLGFIWCGGLWLQAVCFVLCALLLHEYVNLCLAPYAAGLRGGVQVLGALCAASCLGWTPALPPAHLPMVGLLGVLGLVLLRPPPLAAAMHAAGLSLLGLVWCSQLLSRLPALRSDDDGGLALALLALLATWCSDTSAYAAGRLFGRRRLYAQISPSKTVEGALGGLCGGGLCALALAAVLPAAPPPATSALLGALCAITGLVGDLCESMLKRSVGAKDSSRLIPGHGGVFDRFDGVLFAVAAVSLLAPHLATRP